MRQDSGMLATAASALSILLTMACTPAMAGGASSPEGAATPATLESGRKTGGQDAQADSQQPGASPAGTAPSDPQTASSPQIASPSSPLPTSSPLSHTAPSPAATPGRTGQADAAAGSRPQARSSAAWTVSFDTAGGSSIGSQTIPDGSQASRPTPDPSRDGYLFDGWFQGDVAYDFSQPVTGSTTLTARWTSTDTQHWTISPSQGPAAGGAKTTLTPPKPRGIRFSQVSAGRGNDLAIGSDGNLYSWGDNTDGRLGRDTGSKTINSTPADDRPGKVDKPQGAPDGFTWTTAVAGGWFSMAIGSDGNLYTWGNNEKGALGRDTSKTPASQPGKVDKPQGAPDGFTWKCVTGGSWFSMAIGSDGNLYTWGSNDNGQLGRDTSKTPASQPGKVDKPQGAPDGFTWTTAVAGGWFSMAIGSDGNLYSWGSNGNGQLGRSTSTTPYDRPGLVGKPQGAPDGFTWKQIKAGYRYSLAFGSDMNLYAWGSNSSGQLGDGTTTDRSRPARVGKPAGAPDGFVFTQACTKNDHALALGSDGNLYTWGNNNSGQLGRDTAKTPASQPGKVDKPSDAPEGFAWSAIIVGGWRSMAIGSDGNLYTWGQNDLGQLGRSITDATPQGGPGVVGFPGAATPASVLFGQAKTTGITANPDGTWQTATPGHEPGSVDMSISWSRNGPQPDAHLQYTFTAPGHQVGFASANGSCPAPTGMPASQTVVQGGQAERPYPDPKAEGCLFDGWFQGDVAYDFSQPVTGDVTLTAHWTREDTQHWTISPTQGPESGGTEVTLTPPAQRGIRFNQISSGDWNSAAIGSDGNLYAWGHNSYGQLGDGTTTSRSTPVMVDKPAGAADRFDWRQADLSGWHSAAIGSDGNLYTWGHNSYGQLGDGTTTDRTRPVMVDKPAGAADGFAWKQVSLGDDYSAAIGSDGNLYTWGSNYLGQLGDGVVNSRSKPVMISKPQGASEQFTWTQLSLGDVHAGAIGSDGNLYTWGGNYHGQLGDGTQTTQYRPVMVAKPAGAPEEFTWRQVSLGGTDSAAIGSDGNLYTWGNNQYGQLGDGTTTDRYRPVMVDKPQGASEGFAWQQLGLGTGGSVAALGSDSSLYTWGTNNYGQLGDGTATDRHTPVLVGKPHGAPDGFTWKQASLGWYHSAAIGSDGQLYTWGWNGYGQLGRDPSSAWPASRPGPVGFPGRPQATGVCFGQNQEQGTCLAAGKGLKPNPDGTWKVTTPAYTPGMAPVAIDWTQDGKRQETDKGNAYRYLSIASLPLTGGDGMLLLLATGLLAAGAATAAKSHRQQQTRTAA